MPGYIPRPGAGFDPPLLPGERERWLQAIRKTCVICHLEILPGEDRAFGPPARHLDCAIELEAQLDEDHDRG